MDRTKKTIISTSSKTGRLRGRQLAINKPVHAQWQRLLLKLTPPCSAVHRKVFAATWNCRQAPLISDDDLYKEKYVVKDILSYRAAAVAALAVESFGPANETLIEKMQHWRDLFAPAGMGTYRALNATLMKLPGSVPARYSTTSRRDPAQADLQSLGVDRDHPGGCPDC